MSGRGDDRCENMVMLREGDYVMAHAYFRNTVMVGMVCLVKCREFVIRSPFVEGAKISSYYTHTNREYIRHLRSEEIMALKLQGYEPSRQAHIHLVTPQI